MSACYLQWRYTYTYTYYLQWRELDADGPLSTSGAEDGWSDGVKLVGAGKQACNRR